MQAAKGASAPTVGWAALGAGKPPVNASPPASQIPNWGIDPFAPPAPAMLLTGTPVFNTVLITGGFLHAICNPPFPTVLADLLATV